MINLTHLHLQRDKHQNKALEAKICHSKSDLRTRFPRSSHNNNLIHGIRGFLKCSNVWQPRRSGGGKRSSKRGRGKPEGGSEGDGGGAPDQPTGGRKCVTSQIRLRNLCLKFTGGLVSASGGGCTSRVCPHATHKSGLYLDGADCLPLFQKSTYKSRYTFR